MNPQQQYQLVSNMLAQQSHCQFVYLVASGWFSQWKLFATSGETPPPAISNHSLLAGTALRPDLGKSDYVALPSSAWQCLRAWFGGGPEIELFAVDGQPELDVVALQVTTYEQFLTMGDWKSLYIPRGVSGVAFKSYVFGKLNIRSGCVYLLQSSLLVLDLEQPLEFANGDQVVVEESDSQWTDWSDVELEAQRNLSTEEADIPVLDDDDRFIDLQTLASTRDDRPLVEERIKAKDGEPKHILKVRPLGRSLEGLRCLLEHCQVK